MTFAKFISLTCGRIAKEIAFVRECYKMHKWVVRNRTPIPLEYSFETVPRYGYGKPMHEGLRMLIESNKPKYLQILEDLLMLTDELSDVPKQLPNDPKTPYWDNIFFRGLDPISLYGMICTYKPRRYIEIGSGNSTKFARKAIRSRSLETKMTSIDPNPRSEIDELCDVVIRSRFENTDLGIFDELESGDIIMMDGSHYCFMNSDVTVFFLEVLPKLRSGVIVYIDDIFIPEDYPPFWSERYYSEQYLLSVLLLSSDRYEVLLPCHFINTDDQLSNAESKILSALGLSGDVGNGFWMRVK